jgi:acetylornithine deacetylase/succinyl-diaminopimelate desuccinylase-like protein
MSSKDGAVARAQQAFDSGAFFEDLKRRVAIPTESQIPERRPELYAYLNDEIGVSLERLGYSNQIFDNPVADRGPVLLATCGSDPSKPTILCYGHGDVVRGLDEFWSDGLNPWVLKEDGDRVYGRGTVDNKGQHSIAIAAAAAVAEERGDGPGFNMKFIIETGEEQGSPGLERILSDNREAFAADVFIGLDGPRQSFHRMDISLGCRGGAFFDLIVDLNRSGGAHSGHWGGVLPDAGIILAQAISTITTPKGKIQVDGWIPKIVPESVLRACREIEVQEMPNVPKPDPEWGETKLSKPEKVYAWTSFIVLAYQTGNPDNPVNAVPAYAKARCQVRHTVDVPAEEIVPTLRRHLDERGFQNVEIRSGIGREQFRPSRTDPGDPWVQWVARSIGASHGQKPNLVPSSSGSNPSEMFKKALGTPVLWIPHSYNGCKQHGPDEHGLKPLYREGLEVMTGLFWDLGESDSSRPAPKHA